MLAPQSKAMGNLRRQGELSLTSESYSAPLPDPPAGLAWQRNPDKTWSLLPTTERDSAGGALPCKGSEKYGEKYHRVRPEDTLQGVCLQYGCSALELRRLNTISGDASSIQSLKMLRISCLLRSPSADKTSDGASGEGRGAEEQGEPEDLIRQFIEETGEGEAEARFYLKGRRFRLGLALADWKNDDEAATAAAAAAAAGGSAGGVGQDRRPGGA